MKKKRATDLLSITYQRASTCPWLCLRTDRIVIVFAIEELLVIVFAIEELLLLAPNKAL